MRYCNLLCSLLLLLPAGTSAKAYEPEVIGKGVTATWHGRGSILSIDTTIDSETVDSVRSYLAETEGYLTIELTGGGSDYRTAMDLGRVLAEYGGSAAVVPTQASGRTHSQCIDACAVTFLGINPRTAEEGSIAFTGAGVTEIFDFEASSDEVTESRLSILEEFGIYLYESYVDLRIIPRILSASERRSFVPDEIEIIDLGFKFSPSFSDFRLVPYGSGTIAYSRLEGEARAHEWDVHQVSTFCRSGAPRIILSSLPEYKLSILDAELVREAARGFLIGSSTLAESVELDQASISVRDGSPVLLEVRLNKQAIDILTSGVDFYGSIDTYTSSGIWHWGFSLPASEENAELIKASFRFCVG